MRQIWLSRARAWRHGEQNWRLLLSATSDMCGRLTSLQVHAPCGTMICACRRSERQTGNLQYNQARAAGIDCVMLAWSLVCLTWSEKLCGSPILH